MEYQEKSTAVIENIIKKEKETILFFHFNLEKYNDKIQRFKL